MNLQTERIDNHKAQFTIEIETDQLEEAKRQAARKISREVRIKGFRKGKAPYRLVAQYVGEGAILEEALDALGDGLYKRALEESEVVPYGPGAFKDFKLAPAPTLIFTVPLQPEVDLQDYLSVRLDFEAPEVSADEVDEALKQLQMRAVEVVDGNVSVAEAGNRVTIAVDSEFVDGEAQDEPTEDTLTGAADDALTADADDPDDQAADETVPVTPKKGDTFVNDDNTVIILDPNEDPFVHGFVENLIGVELGSDVEFELTIPDDDADEGIAGRRVSFVVTLNSIEAIAIPELDDEFARRMSRSRGEEESNLVGLRATIQADMERSQLESSKSEYADKVLQQIVQGAEIVYPELMLDEQIDGMIRESEGNLKQRGISLDDYLRMTNSTSDDLREQYREPGTQSLRQSLALRELVSAQEIEIGDEEIEARLDNVIAGYGTSDAIRKLFDTPQMKGNIRNELMMSHIHAHLFAIGRGEDGAVVVEDVKAQMAADADRTRERSERAQRYAAEDEAAESADPGATVADATLLDDETASEKSANDDASDEATETKSD